MSEAPRLERLEPTHEMFSFEHAAMWADELSREEVLWHSRNGNVAIANLILKNNGLPDGKSTDAAKLERWQGAVDKLLTTYAAKSPADSLQGQ